MGRSDWKSIMIPTKLDQQIDALVGKMGYTSKMEFVRDAVRTKIWQTLQMEGWIKNELPDE